MAGRGIAAAQDHGDPGCVEDDRRAEQIARRSLRPLDQPLPGLRAWLHLLLRAADSCLARVSLPGSISRPGCLAKHGRCAICCEAALAEAAATECRRSSRSATNTDPYQPIEREYRITRSILEVLSECDHPVGIVTKSSLVVRDIDILGPMAARGLALVCVSVTTLDRRLARLLEPRAPTPARRIETIRRLADAGIPTGVMAAPTIPGLTDHEMEDILGAARDAGARSASYVLLRLPLEIADLFVEWLQTHRPDRASRVLGLMREAHGGKIYESAYGRRMRGQGPYATMLKRRFEAACRRLGFADERPELDTESFKRPLRRGDQLALF